MRPDTGRIDIIRAPVAFTVNVALTDVAITGTPVDFLSAGGNPYFDYGDNLFLESYLITLPYQFGQGALNAPRFQLGFEDLNGHTGTLFEVGYNGFIMLPDANQEYQLGVLIAQPATVDSDWWITLDDIYFNVNMFNTPAALDTEELQAEVMLKVRHTLEMTV